MRKKWEYMRPASILLKSPYWAKFCFWILKKGISARRKEETFLVEGMKTGDNHY